MPSTTHIHTQRDLLVRLHGIAEANRNLTPSDSKWAWAEYQRLTAIINSTKGA